MEESSRIEGQDTAGARTDLRAMRDARRTARLPLRWMFF